MAELNTNTLSRAMELIRNDLQTQIDNLPRGGGSSYDDSAIINRLNEIEEDDWVTTIRVLNNNITEAKLSEALRTMFMNFERRIAMLESRPGGSNRPPTVANPIQDITLRSNTRNTLIDIGDVFNDLNDDILTYSISVTPLNTGIGINGSNVTINANSLDLNTIYQVTLTANDGQGGMVNDIFTIRTINPSQITQATFRRSWNLESANSEVSGMTNLNNEIYVLNSGAQRRNGRVYVYNPTTGASIRNFPLTFTNRNANAIANHNNELYILHEEQNTRNRRVYVYNPTTGAVIRNFALNSANTIPSTMTIYNNELYVVDDTDNSEALDRVYVYNPTTGALIRSFNISNVFTTCITSYNNELYIGEGRSTPTNRNFTVNIYNPTTNAFTNRSLTLNSTDSRSLFAVGLTVYNDELYAASNRTDSVRIYSLT